MSRRRHLRVLPHLMVAGALGLGAVGVAVAADSAEPTMRARLAPVKPATRGSGTLTATAGTGQSVVVRWQLAVRTEPPGPPRNPADAGPGEGHLRALRAALRQGARTNRAPPLDVEPDPRRRCDRRRHDARAPERRAPRNSQARLSDSPDYLKWTSALCRWPSLKPSVSRWQTLRQSSLRLPLAW